MVYGSLSGLAVWNEVSVALYCADIAPTRGALDGGGAGLRARPGVVCGGRKGTIQAAPEELDCVEGVFEEATCGIELMVKNEKLCSPQSVACFKCRKATRRNGTRNESLDTRGMHGWSR